MAEINLNPLSDKQRKILQIGVVAILLVFLGIYFLIPKKQSENKTKNDTVYIENSTLHVFDDSYSLEQYPDRVLAHYPYIVMVKPTQSQSIAYNVLTRDKKSYDKTLVDFDGTNTLTNQDKTTWYNQADLGILCDIGFIKSDSEILCVTRISSNDSNNKLVSIDINTKKQKDVYFSENLITAISVINDEIYIGSINQFDNKSLLRINDIDVEFPDVVSLIYEKNRLPFVASLKSPFNNNIESSYLLTTGEVSKETENKILFYLP